MNNDYAQILLEDKEIQRILKTMIMDKSRLYDSLSLNLLQDQETDALLEKQLTPAIIGKLVGNDCLKDELHRIKTDLSSMCFHLNKGLKKISDDNKWESAYDYATRVVKIRDVITLFLGSVNLNRNINCPFHKDNHPSFKVYPDKNFFICFSCGIRGSPIDFVMKYKNCSFVEAVLYLSNL